MYCYNIHSILFFFFFNDTATTEIYTLSLHDALPILSSCFRASCRSSTKWTLRSRHSKARPGKASGWYVTTWRSEEHTSELQSRSDLVCRLLLEKKKNAAASEVVVTLPSRSRRLSPAR